jgi:CCR4-NOT transcription complex subunit 1
VQQILLTVLDSTLFTFSIRLATLAFRKDRSYLEKWLTEKLGAQSETFLEVLHDFPDILHVDFAYPHTVTFDL